MTVRLVLRLVLLATVGSVACEFSGVGDLQGAPPQPRSQPAVSPLAPAGPSTARPNRQQELANWQNRLQTLTPKKARDFLAADKGAIAQAASAVEAWAFQQFIRDGGPKNPAAKFDLVLGTQEAADKLLADTLQLRTEFADIADPQQRHQAALNYLSTMSSLIDLTGRLRYLLYDEMFAAFEDIADQPAEIDTVLTVLARHRSAVGANAAADFLVDPPAPAPGVKVKPIDWSPLRQKILKLIADSKNAELLRPLVQFASDPKSPPKLVILAAEAIRQVGLPQEVRPDQPKETPEPAITPRGFLNLVTRVNAAALPADYQKLRADLLNFAQERVKKGVVGALSVGPIEVQAGDFFLMRNPSPYNLVTDLNPGLFTHVGFVAEEHDAQGARRLVIVDLAERGTHIPATNVELYVRRTLHYAFFRHQDSAVCQKLSEVAASTVGNEAQFDLNFRTDRVLELKDQPLAGKKIHTYCAGFLLLCTQQTGHPREEFFPLAEAPAGGKTRENLAKLGLTFGDNFISPTGAMFSKSLALVGRCEPMYEPRREVEEAVYDHFAVRLVDHTLTPSEDLFQSIRGKLAEASRHNPLLAKAIAAAANVSDQTDLVSAAKAAAVVETLDELATSNSREFLEAHRLLLTDPDENLSPSELSQQATYRQRHAALAQAWTKQQISARAVRLELLKYYIQRGKDQLDARFFQEKK